MIVNKFDINYKSKLIKRLKSKIFINTNKCWEWQAAKIRGYATISICYKTSKYTYNSMQPAHRVSYEIFVGKIPKKMFVCHKCDNKSCINPKHLFIGNARDNALDMINKNRGNMKRGKRFEHNPSLKLSITKVKKIKLLLSNKKLLMREIAKKFDVHINTIQNIKFNKSWNDVNK